jgi:hypothetical protein
MLVDRFEGVVSSSSGAAVMCLGEILFPLSQSVFLLYTFRILTGIGASCLYLSIVKEVDTLFGEKNFSAILGTIIFFGYSGDFSVPFPSSGWWSVSAGELPPLYWDCILRGARHLPPGSAEI